MICPLKFSVYANPSSKDTMFQCHKEKCAWWHPYQHPTSKEEMGRCAIRDISDALDSICGSMPS